MAQINTRIILRNDSSFNWLMNESIVLLQGEFGVEFLPDNTCKVKIGDGVTPWKDLAYFGGEQLISDDSTIIINDKTISLKGFQEAANGSFLGKNAKGELEWIVPSTEEIDTLKLTVSNLEHSVDTIVEDVTTLENILLPKEENAIPLLTRVEDLEYKVNETGDGTIDAVIDHKINDFATKISDDGTINTLKELIDYVSDHGAEFSEVVNDVTTLQKLVGTTSVATQIEQAIADSGHISRDEALQTLLSKYEAKHTYERKKYEILNLPKGAVVDYSDKEIRVFCPKDTKWEKQNVGANGNPNMYYMTFKAYAPEGAVSFREGDRGVVENTLHTFKDSAAGTDLFGRNYSVCWLALASYSEESNSWNYFGKTSSTAKYIGWTYIVEWYDENGFLIDSDIIKINLSNEDCHYAVEPYYMANTITGATLGGTVLEVIGQKIEIPVGAGLKESDEIAIGEDGQISIKRLSWDKITEGDQELILNGGSAV